MFDLGTFLDLEYFSKYSESEVNSVCHISSYSSTQQHWLR